MSLAMKARQKVKRKGPAKDRVFGCDLMEHLQSSGHDIPQVLKSCTEFVEKRGIVDGIYRLSGGSLNIQKLRLEFENDRNPDLNKEPYLQDVHCVSSICKAYFRELPNPLLTYQLYDKFAEAVAIQLEESRLEKIKEVLKELPSPHHRTLEFLMKHLVHMASFSSKTNMHVRNLAIVWAPNLLRSKDIEVSGFNGTAAFMEVRIQSIVVEFILTHVEQIFGNAPLCGGTRESIRRSLLALSPMVLPDYCTPYNVPTMLNQGDGPPQMRPYHTIIELSESKRKGSVKAKKWKSIFNLGRSKLNKAEDKNDKLAKMRLRPAKSMDSLSCVQSVGDDDARRGTEIPPKHESFDGPVSLDSSFSESTYMSAKSKCEDTQEEATKSEPTTPKTSRSGLIGGTSQGRSPKSSRNRAEKCAGVHISGPFSVTVPFHITSNLTLSRLTRGLECPALSYSSLETPEAVSSNGEDFPRVTEDSEKLMSALTANKEADEGANVEAEMDAEESQMSMEVEDSFSFLDSPDGWIDNVLEEEQLQTDAGEGPGVPPRSLDSVPSMEDDLGSGFMNEMIAAGIELEMYSMVPHLDYLSIEECMNEQSEGEDDQYYLAMGYIEEEPSKEVDAEEVYLSAFDDLSPIASKVEHLRQSDVGQTPHIPSPKLTVEDQISKMATETLVEDPKSSHLPEPGLEPQRGDEEVTTRSTRHLVVIKDLDPKLAKPREVEFHVESRSNADEMERHLTDKAEVEPIFSMLQIEDANVGSEVGLFVPRTECPEEVAYPKSLDSESGGGNPEGSKVEPIISSLQIEGRNGGDLFVPKTGCPEKVACQTPWDPEPENQPIQSSIEEKWQPPNTPESEQIPHLPCSMRVNIPPEVVGRCNQPLGETLVVQGMGEMHHDGDAVEELNLLQRLIPSLLDNNPENVSFPAPNPEHMSFSYFPATLSDGCMDSEDFSLIAFSPKPCLENLPQKPQPGLPAKASCVPKHGFLDGGVHMKLTSTTPRVQQVKSFPVVPPKPQFAKVPPSLKPVIPRKEPLIAVPVKGRENGTKQEFNQSSLKRPFHLTSSDSNQKTERLPTSPSPSISSEHSYSGSETLPKQRNSMPVSLEKFSKDCKNVEDIAAKPPPSSRDKCFSWSKSGDVGGSSLHLVQGSGEKQSSGQQYDEGKGGHLYGTERPTKEALEGTSPQKQRWSNWRYSGSMSFDEAVALAKERHVAQAPMRRMQTYSYGEVDGSHGASKTETTEPAHKPILRSPQWPQSCISPAGPPEAPLLGKVPCPPGLLPDSIPERGRTPRLESSSFSQDFPLRNRVRLSKIGRRLSVSDEACFGLSHEQR
ncbi:rho GTPase-activating protein 30 isoform X2 [Ahaetulla prasina]|uniref:rho GTPase-activating protein 30 isoform X2 n=1 Tax=Ahaetulla prasina TaxID=499056 RepID=UPI00264832BF|nr:rho GTPase-activating protein 30 isoform X2 [Ahaetulla prasina]